MQEHTIYWKSLTDRGIAILFGLVLDPKGAWGVGILEVTDYQMAYTLGTNPGSQSGFHV
jgi:hypothetical protein